MKTDTEVLVQDPNCVQIRQTLIHFVPCLYFKSTCRETEFSEKNGSGSDCSRYVSRMLAQVAKYDNLSVNIVCAGGNREGKAQDCRHYFETHSFFDDTCKLYFRSIT